MLLSFAIVVVGYNRPKCIQRLLTSLKNVEYCNNNVPLVISIDYSGSDDVLQCARNFDWPYGEKNIIEHKKRLGLKEHILSCGQLTDKYDNIAVFEDDLFVSIDFFSFAKQALDKYSSDERIAGIGLYNQQIDQYSGLPFVALNDGYDTYFVQYPCSWGQIWTKHQWKGFYNWYLMNSAPFSEAAGVPKNVCKWDEESWLKYHVRYCVDHNKFFVYPQKSLTTNFSTKGTHNKTAENSFQVPLLIGKKEYSLTSLDESNSVYDVFFENLNLYKNLNIARNDINIDLHGSRNIDDNKRYILTTKNMNYKILKTYGLEMRPIELNIIYNIEGKIIKLYDTNIAEAKRSYYNDKDIENEIIHYHAKGLYYRRLLSYAIGEIVKRIKDKFKSFMKHLFG